MTKTPLIAAGALLGAGLILSGCGLQHVASPTKEETKTYDVPGTLGVLRVESGSGTVVVTESTRSSVKVVETLHWKGDKPATRHPVTGGTLLLGYACGANDWGCGVDYRVEIPRGLRVDVDSGSGDITLRALSGEVQAKSGSGAIDANGLGGKRAIAKTGSGDVELRFTATPEDVKVETGSGTGVVWVPENTYHVTAKTGSGDRQVEVTGDQSAPRRIVVETGSGDVKVLKA